jgi:cytoskeletal protein CcmA (bactofilin family)
VSGTIRYGKITIEEGGELSGDIATLGTSSGAQASKSTSASTNSADIMTAYDPFAHKAKVAKTASGIV